MGHPPLRVLLIQFALASCGGGGVDPDGPRTGPEPPDVVVILLDTLRADALSFYGNERETAPFLASLAAQGTVFQNAYSVSTWTAPATASLLTGVYPDRHGVIRGFLAQFREGEAVDEENLARMELLSISSDVPTLAELFKDLGYRTYGIASNVNIGPEMEFERGFDRFERHDLQPARFLRERLLEWRDELVAGDAPYFLYLHFNDVHKPYNVRPRFYRPDAARDETAELRARYESELSYLDSFLARVHDDFDFGDDTLIVIASDHGEEFEEHGRRYHEFSLHVELNWVPLIVRAPRLRVRPGTAEGNVSLIDVAPTLFDLIGMPIPEGLDGRSVAPLCWSEDKGPDVADVRRELTERPLFLHRFEEGEHLWGVILGRWKLIRADEGYLLYDLVADPGEESNVFEQNVPLAQQLEALLEGHKGRGSQPKSKRTNVEIDQDLLDRLREAGYVGGEGVEEED